MHRYPQKPAPSQLQVQQIIGARQSCSPPSGPEMMMQTLQRCIVTQRYLQRPAPVMGKEALTCADALMDLRLSSPTDDVEAQLGLQTTSSKDSAGCCICGVPSEICSRRPNPDREPHSRP